MVKLKADAHLYGANPYEVTPDDEPQLLGSIREIANDPAFVYILPKLTGAQALGLDPTDPLVLERLIAAGRAEYAAKVGDAAPPPLRRREPYPRLSPTRHASIVYYMRQGTLIKIGTTINLPARFGGICPEVVEAIEFGGPSLEARRHSEFADDWSHGEWFRMSGTLLRHLARLRSVFRDDSGRTLWQWLDGRIPSRALPPVDVP